MAVVASAFQFDRAIENFLAWQKYGRVVDDCKLAECGYLWAVGKSNI
jgi:hypothetical protein